MSPRARKVAGNIARRCVDAASRGLFAPGGRIGSVDQFSCFYCCSRSLFLLPVAKKIRSHYGEGLIVSIPLPEREVEQVVEDVVQNGVIRGTKEYNKDEFVARRDSRHILARFFPPGLRAGKVFYKVREQALDPAELQGQQRLGNPRCALYTSSLKVERTRCCASMRFLRKTSATSCINPTVRSKAAEYQDIREHVDAIELMQKQNVEALNERREKLEKKQTSSSQAETGAWPVPQSEQPAAAAPVESHQDAAPSGTTQVASESMPDQSQPVQEQPIQNQPMQNQPMQSQAGQDQPSQDQPGPSLPSGSGPAAIASGQSLEEHVKRSPPAARAASERSRSTAEIRALPYCQHAAVIAHWHGSPDCDFDALLVRRGNARRSTRMDYARRLGAEMKVQE